MRLLNRNVGSDQDLDQLKAEIDEWASRVQAVISQCGTPSEVSSFRVLGSLHGRTWLDSFNPEHNQQRLMLNTRLERLEAVCRRLEANASTPHRTARGERP